MAAVRREGEAAQGPHADAAMTAFTGETERSSEAAFKVARATFRREHALFLLLGVAVLLWVHHAVGPAVLANSKSWLLLALGPFLTRLVLCHLRHANAWGCSTTAEGGDCAKTRCTSFMRKRCLIVLTLLPRKTIGQRSMTRRWSQASPWALRPLVEHQAERATCKRHSVRGGSSKAASADGPFTSTVLRISDSPDLPVSCIL